MRVVAAVVALAVIVTAGNVGQLPLKGTTSAHSGPVIFPALREQIGEVLGKSAVPGYALAIVRLDEDVEYENWGVRTEGGEPMTSDTLFVLASVSKQFTSTAIGLIIDDYTHGRNVTPLPGGLKELNWKTKVKDLLPGDWALMDEWASEKANLNDILSHVSGLPRHDLSYGDKDDTPLDIVRRLRYLRPEFELREHWHYNNQMYTLASHLVTVLTNESFTSFTRRRIFEPLGMMHSTFDHSKVEPDLVTHSWIGTPVNRRFPSLSSPSLAILDGGAGAGISSAEDMSRWARTLLRAWTHKEQIDSTVYEILPEVMSPQALTGKVSDSPGFDRGRWTYGKGWYQQDYRGHRYIQHSGGLASFSTLVTLFPDDGIGIVQLANVGGAGRANLDISLLIADAALGLEPLSSDIIGVTIESSPVVFSSLGFLPSKSVQPRIKQTAPIQYSRTWPLDHFAGSYFDMGYGALTLCSPRSTSPHCKKVLSAFASVEPKLGTPTDQPPDALEVLYASWKGMPNAYIRLFRLDDEDGGGNGERVAHFELGYTSIWPEGYGTNRTAFELDPNPSGTVYADFVVDKNDVVVGVGLTGLVGEPTERARLGGAVETRAEVWFVRND